MKLLTRLPAGVMMCVVALLCGFFALRLAIHGREVAVPNLAGLSDADAASAARKLGLNLSVENRFYSAGVTPNHVLSQSPAPGARVRRGWQVRVTESLGAQQVAIPDLTGDTERPASLILRRLQLELGATAHLPAPGPSGIVLAQSPPPNSVGLTGPRVALLVTDDEPAASSIAYVMPSLVGQTLAAASLKLASAGLHIASATEPDNAPPPDETAGSAADASASSPAADSGAATGSAAAAVTPAPVTAPAPAILSVDARIIAQSPLPGHRVSRADNIRVTLAHSHAGPDVGSDSNP